MSTLETLAAAKPCPELGRTALPEAAIREHLALLPGWNYAGDAIERTFRFANYYETIAFVNLLASIAHAADHHPDLSAHYNRVHVRYQTHDAEAGRGGVTMNDLIVAARLELALRLTA